MIVLLRNRAVCLIHLVAVVLLGLLEGGDVLVIAVLAFAAKLHATHVTTRLCTNKINKGNDVR